MKIMNNSSQTQIAKHLKLHINLVETREKKTTDKLLKIIKKF